MAKEVEDSLKIQCSHKVEEGRWMKEKQLIFLMWDSGKKKNDNDHGSDEKVLFSHTGQLLCLVMSLLSWPCCTNSVKSSSTFHGSGVHAALTKARAFSGSVTAPAV